MVEKQNGKCKICGCVMTLEGKQDNSVCVDHCHMTGKNRGLLCRSCNLGLSYFKDDIDRLLSAIVYIKENQ